MKLITVLLSAVLLSGCDLYEGAKAEIKHSTIVRELDGDAAKSRAIAACGGRFGAGYTYDASSGSAETDGFMTYKVFVVINGPRGEFPFWCHVDAAGHSTIL